MKILRKIINFINPFHKSINIHFTNKELIPIYENVKLKHIPSIGDKVFFNDKDNILYIIDIVHFYKNDFQLIYVVIDDNL